MITSALDATCSVQMCVDANSEYTLTHDRPDVNERNCTQMDGNTRTPGDLLSSMTECGRISSNTFFVRSSATVVLRSTHCMLLTTSSYSIAARMSEVKK